jgi:hypothetical protein
VERQPRRRRARRRIATGRIRGRPVIDGDLVVAVSRNGIVAAIDLRTRRTWDANVGGTGPWLAGEFIFLISNNAELLA